MSAAPSAESRCARLSWCSRPNLARDCGGYADVDGIAPDLPRLSKPFRSRELAGALAELKVRDGA